MQTRKHRKLLTSCQLIMTGKLLHLRWANFLVKINMFIQAAQPHTHKPHNYMQCYDRIVFIKGANNSIFPISAWCDACWVAFYLSIALTLYVFNCYEESIIYISIFYYGTCSRNPRYWRQEPMHRKTPNISRTLVGNKIVDNSGRRCSNCIFILDLTLGFNGLGKLGKGNCKTRWETFKFWDLCDLY